MGRSLPSAQETRPFGDGCISVQDGEEDISLINWALNTASLWKLKAVKAVSTSVQ